MAGNGRNKINFEVGFITDSKGLDKLKSELAEIRAMANDMNFASGMDSNKLQAMVKSANDLEYAMNAAFDVDLNTVNIQKFNQILKQSGTDLKQIQAGLAQAGTTGQSAFLKATAGLMQFNTTAKQTNKFLDSIATSFANTIKWSAMSSIINTISGTIQQSYYYVKDLDTALNDIRIVTGKNAEEMSRFAESANDAAKALAVTTEDYTQGSLIYYQQGLDDETVKALTDITAKTSNVTGQSMSAVSEELTAVWNGYKVANEAATEGMQIYEEYVDKMAAVGASTASDLQELSTAMSKVASAASAMGVNFDDLNAQIATIVSVTRQAPESVGTALKTIYARLGDLKVDGVDEFGTKLGEVTAQMQTMGIQILDQNGDMRAMSDVMAEVAEKWDTWTSAQRQAAAVAMAGKRQYNNLVALFDNWDMYGDALKVSMEAAGTLEEQQEIALDSLANKMDTLKATAEDLYDSLYDEEDIKSLVEGTTKVVQVLADFSDSIGGLINLIPMLGATATRVFSNQIANGLSTIVINAQNASKATQTMTDNYNQLKMIFSDSSLFAATDKDGISSPAMLEGVDRLKEYYGEMQQYQSIMSKDQKETYNNILNNVAKVGELNVKIEEGKKSLLDQKTSWDLINKDLVENEKELSNLIKKSQNLNLAAAELEENLESASNLDWAHARGFIKDLSKKDILPTEDVDKLLNKFEELRQIKGKGIDGAFQDIIDKLKTMGVSSDEVAKLTQQMKNLRDGTKEAGESLRDNLSLQQHISNITNTVGALGQLATSINTIKNLGNIWSDKDITTGEKILQTAMNLGFVLPNITSAIGRLNTALGINSSIIQVLMTKNTANNAIQAAGLKISGKITKEKVEEAILQKILNQLKIDSTQNISKETAAKLINLNATELEKKALEEATVAQTAFNTSVLANPYVAIGAIIIGAVVGITAAYKAHNKALKENAQAELESLKTKEEEINKNEELYQSYHSLKKDYDNGVDNKEELRKATEELCKSYDIEISKLDLLSEKYDEVNARINEKRKQTLEEQRSNLTSQLDNQAMVAEQTAREGTGWKTLEGRYQVEFSSKNLFTSNDFALQNSLKNNLGDYWSNINYGLNIEYGNMDELVEAYHRVEEAQKDYIANTTEKQRAESADYKVLTEWLSRNGEQVKAYEEIQEKIKDTDAELVLLNHDFSKVDSLEKYNQKIKETANELANLKDENGKLIYTQEEAIKLAKDHAASMTNATETFANQSEIISEIAEEVGQSEDKVQEFIEGLDENQKEIIFSGQVDIDHLGSLENIKKAIELIQGQINKEDLSIVVSLRDKVTSDKKLSKKQVQEMMGEESNLAKDYEVQMADFDMEAQIDQVDILNGIVRDKLELDKQWIENTAEMAQAEIELVEIRKKEAEIELSILEKKKDELLNRALGRELTDEEKEALEELNQEIAANVVAIENYGDELEHLQELIDKGFAPDEISTTIFDDMVAGIDGVISKADVLKDLVSVVGENWTLAAGKVEEFAQNFPEVLRYQENYNTLQDGSIQLTEKGKQVLQEELGIKKQELIAENKAYQEQLQHQADLLYMEAEYYQAQADNLADYLNGRKTGAQTEADLERELRNYEQKIADATGQKLTDIQNAVRQEYSFTDEQARGNTEDIYNYWCSVGAAAAAAGQAYEAKEFEPPGFNQGANVGVKKTSYNVRDTGQETNFFKAENVDQIAELQAELQKRAESARNRADVLISKKAASESATQASINALDNAASGKGNEKSKDKSKSKKDHKEDEPDRYWEINKALDEIARTLKKVDKLKSHVFGKQKIQVLKQESELIKQQTKLYEKLYEEQKKEAEELRGKLTAGGVAFTAEGEITNYGEALKSALATYNAAVDQFNAGLMDDEAFKVAEKNYENFKKNVDRYDKLFYTEMKDTKEKIEDAVQTLRDKNLEIFEIKLQVKLDKKSIKRDFIKFRQELQEDFTKNFKILPDAKYYKKLMNSYTKGKNSTISVDTKAIDKVTKEIDKMMAGGSSDIFASVSEAQEKLKELKETLFEDARAAKQIYEDAYNDFLDKIDQTNEKLEQQNKEFERVKDTLDSYKQMIELLYGDKAYDQMNEYYQQAKYNSLAQVESIREQADAYKVLFEDQMKREGASMSNMSNWSKELTTYYDTWMDKQQELNDLTIEHIKLLQDDWQNSINEIFDNLEKKMAGISFEDMDKEWEWATKNAELYYNSVQKAYNIQTLSNKINKGINQQKDIKNQQKLIKLRDQELSFLKEKEKVTEYDVKAAEARYNIALKEIALEDARNNKTTMKLSRNAEGNWAYQYVADENDIEDKQQDYLDALMDLQNLSSERTDNLTKEISDTYKAYNEELRALGEKYMKGAIQKDEYDKKIEALEERHNERLKFLSEQLGIAQEDVISSGLAVKLESYRQDQLGYITLTQTEQSLLDQFHDNSITSYQEMSTAIKTDFDGIGTKAKEVIGEDAKKGLRGTWNTAAMEMAQQWNKDNGESVTAIYHQAIESMSSKTNSYKEDIHKLEVAANKDFGKITDDIKKTKTQTDNADKAVKKLTSDMQKDLPKAADQVLKLKEAWEAVAGKIQDATDKIEAYLKKQQDIQAPSTPNNIGSTTTGGGGSTGGGGNPSGGSGGNGGSGSGYTEKKTGVIKNGILIKRTGLNYQKHESYWNIEPISSTWAHGPIESFIYPDVVDETKGGVVLQAWKSKRLGDPVPYDTGGYTGSWGNEGRLATLHQKELVLNAKDTENFLAATKSLRNLVSLDSSIEKSIADAISKMLIHMANTNANTSNINTSNNNESNTNNVFNINAEFPNANDVTEIREAILSLPNLASQYIHKNGF